MVSPTFNSFQYYIDTTISRKIVDQVFNLVILSQAQPFLALSVLAGTNKNPQRLRTGVTSTASERAQLLLITYNV